jgi:hypothetical protein
VNILCNNNFLKIAPGSPKLGIIFANFSPSTIGIQWMLLNSGWPRIISPIPTRYFLIIKAETKQMKSAFALLCLAWSHFPLLVWAQLLKLLLSTPNFIKK